jgi:hypothetical protein
VLRRIVVEQLGTADVDASSYGSNRGTTLPD